MLITGHQLWLTAAVVLFVLGGLIHGRISADLVLLGGLAALLVFGVVEPTQAVSGFANPAVVMVAALYVVAAALRSTGALTWVTARVVGQPKQADFVHARVALPVALGSAFVNNTPIVAMLLPTLSEWAKRYGIAPGRLLMPLSFAAILGGMCTLIGTSTTLVVNGLLLSHAGAEPMGMFTISPVGVPVALVGLVFVIVAGRWLLPQVDQDAQGEADEREYTTALRVVEGSPVAGATIEAANLRNLPGLYLSRVEREHQVIVAVGPQQVLRVGDVLVFVGAVGSVADLRKIRGLEPLDEELPEGVGARRPRLLEAVVAAGSRLVGRTVRDAAFRTRYGAVIVGVHRRGARMEGKIGAIELEIGDTLLLEVGPEFSARSSASRDFYLATELPDAGRPRYGRAPHAVVILTAMIGAMTWRPEQAMTAALCAALAMVLLRCLSGPEARASIDLRVLLAIGAAFGLGAGLENSGMATAVGAGMMSWGGQAGPTGLLIVVFVVTAVLTSVITNNAAAILMFPLVLAVVRAHGLPLMPFALCLAIAASSGFSTPLGYQTNLMVQGPGNYRAADFLRFGLPLTVVCGVVCVLVLRTLYGLA